MVILGWEGWLLTILFLWVTSSDYLCDIASRTFFKLIGTFLTKTFQITSIFFKRG